MLEIFGSSVLVAMLAATLRIATPLALAAIGELVVQRSGIWNLAIEGTMLMAAFVAYMVGIQTGSPLLGLILAVVAGVMMNLTMGICSVTLKLNQFVVGLGLNMLASGATLFLYREALIKSGGNTLPPSDTFAAYSIPGLSRIPYIGEIFFTQQPITYLAFLMVPAVWLFLYRTRYGLEIRSLGENPKAIDSKGLSVDSRQFTALAFGGAMTGLAGAFLVLAMTDRFVPGMTGGRGWLALVAIIAGQWRPAWTTLAVLTFAALEAFQLQTQGIGIQIPYQLLLALPYVFAIVVMMIVRVGGEQPERLGVPYIRN